MESSSTRLHDDLQWLMQAIRSDHLALHCISIHLSQFETGCHQAVESSMNINISKHNDTAFAEVLRLLGSSGYITSSLRNLEFNFVEWDSTWIQQLGILLESLRGIKQLLFKQNRFGNEGVCVSELCEILKRNKFVKEVIFAESRLGSQGMTLLASALKVNDTIEEVQIWEDSIGSQGAEELAKMIEVNSSLKLITVFDLGSDEVIASPVISAVLARNRAIEVHLWGSSSDGGKIHKVVEFVPGDYTLRIYKLSVAGSCRVACSMGMNSTVRVLDMTGVRLRSHWAKEFRFVLEQNQCLKEVILSKTCLKNKAVVYVAAGLFKNRSLHSLFLDGNLFSGIGVEHLLTPLSRFSALQLQANVTLKSVIFGGPRNKIGRDGLTAILQMISTNQTVTHLGIRDDRSLKPQDFIKIFETLGTNASLLQFDLSGCRGVTGEPVARAILEMLQVNSWIKSIALSRTPLENEGLTEAVYQKLGQTHNQNSAIETDLDHAKDLQMSSPKSCRVFLCGQDHAGKTTLSNSISQHFNFSASTFSYAEHVKNLVKPIEQVTKPDSIQIKYLKDNDIKISIWNLAGHGQHEFYPLQDLMFPGSVTSATFFFIVSSLFQKPSNRKPKSPAEVEEDILYWLRLIASNSRRANQDQLMLPNVTVVLTHFDKINNPSMQNIVDIIQRLRDKFQGFIDIYPTVFTIDARSHSSVSKLTYHLRATSKTILQRVPRVYDLCNEVVMMLAEWRGRNNNKEVMRWRDFSDLCQVKVPLLRVQTQTRRGGGGEMVEMRRKGVAKCLHDLGEVMYFEELGILILDCEWFCVEVLGQVVKLNVTKVEGSLQKRGLTTRDELEKVVKRNFQSHIPGMSSRVLENMAVSDIVSTMIKLNICYLQDPSDQNSLLLVPSILEDGRGRSQRWGLSAPDCVYAGRHLECVDLSHMFLTPGSFPRLQVHLYNKIMGGGNQHGASYSLEKYLIVISINGVNIRVELGGHLTHFVDVLACSTKTLTETLRLIQQLIIPAIHSCCDSVPLTEHIIRPQCVKDLTPPRLRASQSVQVQRLKLALLSVPAEGIYEYKHTWSEVSESGRVVLKPGFDFARELLSEDDLREVLNRRYQDLYNLAIELQVPEDRPENSSIEAEGLVDPTLGGIARGVEQVLQRLKIIEQEIRDVKQEIQGLRYYEQRLLLEMNRKIEYLLNFNLQLEERKVPNMFYFVQTESYSRRLVMNMVSGMNAMRLHMLCEFRGEMHVVEDQIGCEVMQVDNKAVQLLAPYMKKFMKLVTFALKIGAHLAAGMGEMIPDLSKEVAHLAGSSSLIHAAAGAAAAGVVEAAVAGGMSRRGDGGRDIQEEQRTAQQWVIDFLRDRRCSSGRDIAEKFGLWRVRYRDDGRIAWICKRHMSTRAQEIIELPF